MKGVLQEESGLSILLTDSVNWVKAKVSKAVEGYFKSGTYEPGDIVDVVRSLGTPDDLHIVSSFHLSFGSKKMYCISI